MVYSVMTDQFSFGGNEGDDGTTLYNVPTSLTCCVSREILAEVLPQVHQQAAAQRERRPLREFIAGQSRVIEPGANILEPWRGRANRP